MIDKAIFEEVDEKISEHHRDRARVVGNSGNKLTYGDLAELTVREALDMHENVLTEL